MADYPKLTSKVDPKTTQIAKEQVITPLHKPVQVQLNVPDDVKKYIDIKMDMLAKNIVGFVDGPHAQKMMAWITQVFAPAFASELIKQLKEDGTLQTEARPDGPVLGLQEQTPQA